MSVCFTCNEPLFNCACGMAQDCPEEDAAHIIETREMLDQMQAGCGEQKRKAMERSLEKFGEAYSQLSSGEERPADEGVTHGEEFKLAPPVRLDKRCFVHCGDRCNCLRGGLKPGDQVLLSARGGGKSRLRELFAEQVKEEEK